MEVEEGIFFQTFFTFHKLITAFLSEFVTLLFLSYVSKYARECPQVRQQQKG